MSRFRIILEAFGATCIVRNANGHTYLKLSSDDIEIEVLDEDKKIFNLLQNEFSIESI